MKKMCVMIMAATFSMNGFSQTVKQKVEKEIQSPQRKENAGKADVISANRKNIFDSTTFINDNKEIVNNKAAKTTTKKHTCKKKEKL